MVLLLFEVAHSQIVLASINIENSARPTAQHAQVLGRYTREGAVFFIFTHLSWPWRSSHAFMRVLKHFYLFCFRPFSNEYFYYYLLISNFVFFPPNFQKWIIWIENRKLIDGLRCIDNFTSRCLDAQHREFFHMLYAGTKQVIVDLCEDEDYQKGWNSITFQQNRMKHLIMHITVYYSYFE